MYIYTPGNDATALGQSSYKNRLPKQTNQFFKNHELVAQFHLSTLLRQEPRLK